MKEKGDYKINIIDFITTMDTIHKKKMVDKKLFGNIKIKYYKNDKDPIRKRQK